MIYFGISAPFSSLSLFTPSITAGLGYNGLEAQLMTVPPYAVAYVVQIAVAFSADRMSLKFHFAHQRSHALWLCLLADNFYSRLQCERTSLCRECSYWRLRISCLSHPAS